MSTSIDFSYLRRSNHLEKRLMILSVNQKCNLKCTYCRGDMDDWYDRLALNSINKELPESSWGKLVQICSDINVDEILITGGEPLLYTHLHNLILFLHGAGIRCQIHTNGLSKRGMSFLSFFNDEQLRPLLNVSSELTEAMQKSVRGCDLPLPFIKQATLLGYKVDIKVVLHQQLLPLKDELTEIIMWWKSTGVSTMRFQPVAPIDHLKMDHLLLTPAFIPFLDELQEIITLNDELKNFISHSAESIEGVKSQIMLSEFRLGLANRCSIINKMVFLNTDLEYLNCKTLWGRSEADSCEKVFDFLCCGFQR